jgi:ankyrin repeat protein
MPEEGDTVMSDEIIDSVKAGNLDEVKKAIEGGLSINFKDSFFSDTLLHAAASAGHLDIVMYLVEAGADLLVKNGVDFTPIHLAARDGQLPVVKYLLDQLDDIEDRVLMDIINVAQMSVSGHPLIVEALYKFRMKVAKPSVDGLNENDSLLLVSSRNGDLDGVKKALDDGANIAQKCGKGMDAMIWASLRGNTTVVAELLGRGADINTTNDAGWTPIIQASAGGYQDLVMLLLEKGADVNKGTRFEETALMYAAREGYVEIVKLLLANGADKDAEDEDGVTARMLALRYQHSDVVELLE